MMTTGASEILPPIADEPAIEQQFERTQQDESGGNVGRKERWGSIAAGAIAAIVGLARRDKLGVGIAAAGGALIYRGVSGNCPLYSALGVDTAEGEETKHSRGIYVSEAYTIDKSPQDLFSYWRNLENLPRIMSHLIEVIPIDDRRSHWVAEAPAIAGGQVEWDAEIVEEIPDELIAWRSLPGADVDNAGVVRFEQSERGTIVRVRMRYLPPAGRVGSWIAKIFGDDAHQQI